jgi:hypothetical protein
MPGMEGKDGMAMPKGDFPSALKSGIAPKGLAVEAPDIFGAFEAFDAAPALNCAASFCHCAGSAIERQVPSHCSNIFCAAAGSAGGKPNGAPDAVVSAAFGGVVCDDDEDLEAAIPAFDLDVPEDWLLMQA